MENQPNPETNQPPIEPEIPQKNLHPKVWISVLVVILAVGSYLAYAGTNNLWPFVSESEEEEFCIQVITPARNPETGETRDFPTPCDVPEGWELVEPEVIDETASWQTYRNEEYGFELRYPAEYSVNNVNTINPVIILTLSDDTPIHNSSRIIVKQFSISSQDTVEDIILQDTIFDGSGLHPASLEEFETRVLGDNTFYYIPSGLFEGSLSLDYYIVTEENVFAFDIVSNGADWTNPEFDSENFNRHLEAKQILSTFKFIEEVDTSNWQTYRNEEYGFEFRYPNTFVQDDEAPAKDNDTVLECFKSDNVNGTVFCVRQEGNFSITAIQQEFAPTGLSDFAPEKLTLSANLFYYYGPGGGGVQYPDLYFFDLGGILLVFSFDDLWFNAKTPSKTPSDATKTLARQILSTFRFVE